LTFLICGLGSIGIRHLRILRGLGENKFIALRSGKSKSKLTEKIDEEITNPKDISRYRIDGALITNPTSLHIETAIEVAKNGIPVFIEKPLGKNLDKAAELADIVKKNAVPVLVGYNLRYHPGIESLKKFISEGKIGKVISARAQFGTYMPGWHGDEDYKKSYASNSSMGGGVVLTSIHEQNYLTDMFGVAEDIKAMEVGGKVIGIDAEEGVEILVKHKTGVVSNIHLNFFQRPYYRTCEVIGTEGTLFWDFMIPEIKILYKDKTDAIKLGNDPFELLDKSYSNQMKHFIDVIEKKSEPRVTLQSGIEDMKAALRVLKEIGRNIN
jgi:predicted dehydrogenase